MSSAADPIIEPTPEACPRVIGAAADRLRTCGHTLPCPYHGEPIVRIVQPRERHVDG